MNNNIARDAGASLAALFVVACTSPGEEGPSSPCSGGPVSEDIPVEEVPASPGWDLLRDGIIESIQIKWFDNSQSTLDVEVYGIENVATVGYAIDDEGVRMEDCPSDYHVYMRLSAETSDNLFKVLDFYVRVSLYYNPDESYIQDGFQITILVEEDDVLSEAITPPANDETEAGFNFGMGDDGTRASLHQQNGVELFNSVF